MPIIEFEYGNTINISKYMYKMVLIDKILTGVNYKDNERILKKLRNSDISYSPSGFHVLSKCGHTWANIGRYIDLSTRKNSVDDYQDSFV